MLVDGRQRLVQPRQPNVSLSHFAVGLGQEGKKTRRDQCCSRCLPRGQPLVHLRNTLLRLTLCSQRPAPQDRRLGYKVWKPLLGCEGDRGLRQLPDCLAFAARLRSPRNHGQGERVAEGV